MALVLKMYKYKVKFKLKLICYYKNINIYIKTKIIKLSIIFNINFKITLILLKKVNLMKFVLNFCFFFIIIFFL